MVTFNKYNFDDILVLQSKLDLENKYLYLEMDGCNDDRPSNDIHIIEIKSWEDWQSNSVGKVNKVFNHIDPQIEMIINSEKDEKTKSLKLIIMCKDSAYFEIKIQKPSIIVKKENVVLWEDIP